MSVVYDMFTYNGEADMLEIRLNILNPHVDYFVIGEAPVTFSGKSKPLYFDQQLERFDKFLPKIIYVVTDHFYDPELLHSMQLQYDIKITPQPFLMAFYQKEHLAEALRDAKDDDMVYYGDVDEIWTPQQVQKEPAKLEQLMYSLYLNYRSNEPWKGTAIATVAQVKRYGLNQIRGNSKLILPNGGWHFTNMGGYNEVIRKLESYDHQEVNTAQVKADLAERYMYPQDFLGRDFKLWEDESEWPQFLRETKAQYAHLCR